MLKNSLKFTPLFEKLRDDAGKALSSLNSNPFSGVEPIDDHIIEVSSIAIKNMLKEVDIYKNKELRPCGHRYHQILCSLEMHDDISYAEEQRTRDDSKFIVVAVILAERLILNGLYPTTLVCYDENDNPCEYAPLVHGDMVVFNPCKKHGIIGGSLLHIASFWYEVFNE